MFITYILKNESNQKYYIGHTKNLGQRLLRHNRGLVRSTQNGIPWRVMYTEEFNPKPEAYKRELQIKSYKSGEAFKKLI
ncbi:MAG: GIY-YIG nuclease family protein [Candidatus Kerfeldbacteria bacterium]|nr:GIY-YIG nuclease family protein [Candidatus Kerfeldbacteria bacterium]